MTQYHRHIIRLLPALPKAWPNGSFRGLRARGGVDIDLEWSNGRATEATLRSTIGGALHIAAPHAQQISSVVRNGKQIKPASTTEGLLTLEADPGTTHILHFS